MKFRIALSVAAAVIVGAGASQGVTAVQNAKADLAAAVAAPTRTPKNVARDRYRHPLETLNFFGVKPNQTVVEIWPGGGWYTEILAPYLKQGGGTLYAVAPAWGQERPHQAQDGQPGLYGAIRTADFPAFDAAATRVPRRHRRCRPDLPQRPQLEDGLPPRRQAGL